jgi:hypothetical protein
MCSAEGMSFFPADPDMPAFDDALQPRTPWLIPPADEVPRLYPVAELLASTDHVAIALIGAHVYSDGVELQIERRLRRRDLPRQEWMQLSGVFMEHWHGKSADRLRYGLALSTGERVIEGPRFFAADRTTPPAGSSLVRTGGGGGGGGHEFAAHDGLWLWPIPPAGPIELVVQWPAMDIAQTHTFLDATTFAELAGDARRFWP